MNEAKTLVGLIALVCLVWLVWWWQRPRSTPLLEKTKQKVERSLRAGTPEACPACCRVEDKSARSAGQRQEVRPWSEVKSGRGAPQRVKTEGYACPNRAGEYYGITDERVHAWVGYGGHGRGERIQDLRNENLLTCAFESSAKSVKRKT